MRCCWLCVSCGISHWAMSLLSLIVKLWLTALGGHSYAMQIGLNNWLHYSGAEKFGVQNQTFKLTSL